MECYTYLRNVTIYLMKDAFFRIMICEPPVTVELSLFSFELSVQSSDGERKLFVSDGDSMPRGVEFRLFLDVALTFSQDSRYSREHAGAPRRALRGGFSVSHDHLGATASDLGSVGYSTTTK